MSHPEASHPTFTFSTSSPSSSPSGVTKRYNERRWRRSKNVRFQTHSSSSRTCASDGESIKKEIHEKSEPISTSSSIVAVSRILNGIPQIPHFLPLKGYSKVTKQMLIDAWDHIFEETVDQIISMHINGFWDDAKRVWETIEELQKMGYNVLVLRRRLVELTDVWLARRRHKIEMRRLKNTAEEHRMEQSRLEFEIAKLRGKIAEKKASMEDVMTKVAKMEEEMPNFNDAFTKLAIKLL